MKPLFQLLVSILGEASPGSDAGCGLKLCTVNRYMGDGTHHPAAMPGAD